MTMIPSTLPAILFIICFYSSTGITSSGRPRIQPFTFPNEVNLNQPILVINCIVSSGDVPITFEWLKDGQSIQAENNNNVDIDVRNHEMYSILEMKNLKSKHIGNYTCVASNRFGTESFTSSLLMKGFLL
ncbi:cell adhesion molecule DSCAML1-like isoform X1 [Panonychus citri]|uniref:cell adhesion molecule DSCAML1-like isoform X1 n=1 Tax=Panonychus citri TaxID=50023 RepID=UPI002306FE3F|nr:cell adhesion molecule DSCAML1-like isoform X1 [Panonychus citri]